MTHATHSYTAAQLVMMAEGLETLDHLYSNGLTTARRAAEMLRRLAADMPPAGPSSGITVPLEPTMEMWIAGNKKLPATPIEDSTDYTRAIWKAMLNASPPATDGGKS